MAEAKLLAMEEEQKRMRKELEELSRDKKLALLRGAEAQAKFAQLRKAKFEGGGGRRKFTRWGSPSTGAEPQPTPPAFNSSQFRFPPPAQQKTQCYGCFEFGHIRRNCPKKTGN